VRKETSIVGEEAKYEKEKKRFIRGKKGGG